ncbi:MULTISPECIES: transposase [Brevibacillus]|uniref:transposase n=1 Tax=Brevibacillus TaxID=55080 RepID=UPI0018ED2F38|nr:MULTISPECIES: transposase [Brevibacillus]MED1946285.1 transposase [Brevibacillus formosus]MED1998793.1 transposase [Brevibacillus formosus]MED2084150.1 transposase [Brevibacillus formosus]
MGKIRRTFDAAFKKKEVDLYLRDGMGYKTVAKEFRHRAFCSALTITSNKC